MSPQRVLLVLVVVIGAVVLLPHPAAATEHVVGDADGWKSGFNSTMWLMGKEFRVGDTLVFVYNKTLDNVLNVTKLAFDDCTVLKNSTLRDTGNDTILLKAEGKKWYISGKADHCKKGLKVAINVLSAALPPAPSPAPADAPPSAALPAAVPAGVHILAAALAVAVAVVAVF